MKQAEHVGETIESIFVGGFPPEANRLRRVVCDELAELNAK